MQSQTADFAPGAAIWRTGRNIRDVFDFGPFAPLHENMTSFTKSAMTYFIAIRGGPSHGHTYTHTYTYRKLMNLDARFF